MVRTMTGGFNLIFISFLYFATSVATQDTNITIPLNKSLSYDNKEIYGSFFTLNENSNINVNFSNIPKSLYFIVFQAHSHIFNISLSMDIKNGSETGLSIANGTNVGFVNFLNERAIFQITNHNKNVTVRVYISVHGYMQEDPIPGGCNMELLNVKILPFMYTQTFADYILLEAGAPSAPATDRDCTYPLRAEMKFYMMYLPERNFYPDPYFAGIRTMMTLKGIEEYGTAIPYNPMPATRRRLSAYPGTGAIYAVVATSYNPIDNITTYSVYIPSYSYGCTDFSNEGCDMIDDGLSELLCAALMFIGVFICFFGHRFFKTEMFFAGFFSGVIITYILIALITVVDKPALLAASVVSGIFFGGIWWLFWWLYGIPVLSVLLPSLNLGFLLASIFYYKLPGTIPYLQQDFNFWSLFVLVMMLTGLAVVSVSYAANIICCAVLGSYATVLSIDYYSGSHLKFIIINVIRRAVVPHFNKAFLAPPDSQWRDIALEVMWLILATLGFLFQHWHNRGRPPFPPPPRAVRPSRVEPVIVSYGTMSPDAMRRPIIQQNTGDGSATPTSTPVASRVYTERTGLLA